MRTIWVIFFNILNIIPMPSKIKLIKMSLNSLKRLSARKIFKSIGNNTNFRPHTKIRGYSNISLGNRSSIGDNCKIIANAEVKIGNNVLMAPEVMILTENHNIKPNELIIDSGTSKKSVIIGDDVWIGTRVTILPGAKVGDGVVVAAGAVLVDKEYPPYTIVGGVPARVIKNRS